MLLNQVEGHSSVVNIVHCALTLSNGSRSFVINAVMATSLLLMMIVMVMNALMMMVLLLTMMSTTMTKTKTKTQYCTGSWTSFRIASRLLQDAAA